MSIKLIYNLRLNGSIWDKIKIVLDEVTQLSDYTSEAHFLKIEKPGFLVFLNFTVHEVRQVRMLD